MNLKIGIIAIGSLLWDNSTKREAWRKKYLNSTRTPISLPIRYGRISSSRMNTYTMTYSKNLKKEEYGQGIVIGLKKNVINISDLKGFAEDVIRVERDITQKDWKNKIMEEPFSLNWKWGVLGVCINPKHINEGRLQKDIIEVHNFWQKNLTNFDPNQFSISKEPLMVDKKGVFEIDWTDDIKEYDLLLSTVIEPITNTDNRDYPDSNIITKKMYEGNYYSYFINNIENNITTHNDADIKELIKTKYCVSKYIIEMDKE